MHFNASPEIFKRAKALRMRMTPAESLLWERLSARKLNGLHFRRQHPIFKYILDFYCHKYRLAIELDGEIHEQKDQQDRDRGRENELKHLGIHILRFKNQIVMKELDEVLRIILMEVEGLKKQAFNT